MNLVYLVIIIALFQYFYFGISVGNARGKYGIKAPATSGNPEFERYYRVQMNTLEQLVMFIPSMIIAANFWSPNVIAIIGNLFIIGRFVYFKQYITDPDSRTIGFALTITPTAIFLLASVVGIIKSFI